VLACLTGIPVRVTVASDYAAVNRGAPQPDGRPGVRASRRRRPGEPATVYFPGLASGINTTDGAPLLDGMDPGRMTKRPG
jgi:hypothetical protein